MFGKSVQFLVITDQFHSKHRRSKTPFQGRPLSGTPLWDGPLSLELHFEVQNSLEADYGILKVQNLEAAQYFESLKEVDWVISKVQNSNSKRIMVWKKQTAVFRRSRTRSKLKMDPISWQTRFIFSQKSSRGIRSFSDVYRTNFED
ncbi:hypothetical protein RclHR1_16110004 [Rhizophagus clarus]|uniref:Uncharacterized protein n=1 Tax=Rhizophagus clarus TaxID=94130 RepID=A0A2Z6QGY4_9GLOM|nr:hypothetical protein RclHR1_16110004 [Rhizophagus clarus]